MGMMIFRPGQRLIIPGVQVFQPRGTSAASGGWWDNNGAISGCVAAYQPKGSVSLAASYTNLTGNATYNAAPGVAPPFNTADGWTFNGSSQYLTTGVVPATGWSMIVRISNVVASAVINSPAIGSGVAGSNNSFQLVPADTVSANKFYAYGSGFISTSPIVTSGIMAIAATGCYLNGVADGTISGSFSGAGVALYVGAHNNAGSVGRYFNGKIQAIAIYSTTLSAGNVATITTAMQAL